MTMNDWISCGTALILLVTAVAIFWYTFETRRLVKLTKRQITLDLKPIIVAVVAGTSLRLKNIGRSPALNIAVKDVIRKGVQLKVGTRTAWEAGMEYGLPITPYKDGKPITSSGEAERVKNECLSLTGRDDRYELVVDYNDIEMAKWRCTHEVDSEGVHFKHVEGLG